jgi:putative FmdB family regulatory protein
MAIQFLRSPGGHPMPTYDYVCDACKHEFELYQSIKDDAKKQCPECGKKKLRRLIGPGAAIVFKGSGFYTTDYRSDAYKKAAAADKTSDKPAEKSAEKSAEKASEKAVEKASDKTSDSSAGKKEKGADTGSSKKERTKKH